MFSNNAIKRCKVNSGTTIAAFKYDEGIILAGDSRVTIEEDIINRFADKLTQLRKNIFCCRSGAEADTHAIIERVSYHLQLWSMEFKTEPSVKLASNIIHQLSYINRESMECSLICAGWDGKEGFQVYEISDGMCTSKPYAVAGSGSSYILGYVDYYFKNDLNRKQCLELAENVITLGIQRDGSSGGVVRMFDVTKEGGKSLTISHDKLKPFSSLIA